MTRRRFPIDVILELTGGIIGPDEDGTITDAALAVYLNVNPDSLGKWRRRGWLLEPQAEAVAVELGRHPVELWPEHYYADVEDLDPDEQLELKLA